MMWGRKRRQKETYMYENGRELHEELITTFNGRHKVPLGIFTAKELIRATNNFMNPVVEKKFYRGSLEQRQIIVQKGSFPSRIHDIVISSQMSHHKNAWKLLGCCLEFKSPALVYENHAGFDFLDNLLDPSNDNGRRISSSMSRLRIANDIANAIVYLHMAFPTPIIYCNLGTYNVIVDQCGVAKLFDFSVSVSLPPGELEVIEDLLRGTVGFMAPEYLYRGTLSQKNDVYGFGVLLLVLLTGKEALDFSRSEAMLTDYVLGKELSEILDPKITTEGGGIEQEHQLQAFLQLALKCIRHDYEDRLEMIDVARELRQIKYSGSTN